jgi:ferritin-like protein
MHLIWLEGDGLNEIAEDARLEDSLHFELIIARIYELNGELPCDIMKFAYQASRLNAYPPDVCKNSKSISKVLL